MPNLQYYKTSDTNLATAIIARGFPASAMNRQSDGRVYFSFLDVNQQVSQISEQYWAKALQVDAQTVLMEFKILKQRISNLK